MRICAAGVDGNAHTCMFSPAEFVSRNKKWSGWSGVMSNATHFEYKSNQCLPMCSPCQEKKAIPGQMPISVSSKRCILTQTDWNTDIYLFFYIISWPRTKRRLLYLVQIFHLSVTVINALAQRWGNKPIVVVA